MALFYKDKDLLDHKSRQDLQTKAEALEKLLTSSKLIARTSRNAFLTEELQIHLDPNQLEKYEIPVGLIATKIREAHVQIPAGSLKDQNETKVSIVAGLTTKELIANTPIRSQFEGKTIYLKDLATIKKAYRSIGSITKVNGREAIILNVLKSTNADIIEAQQQSMATIEKFRKSFQKTQLKVLTLDDESEDVRNRINIVTYNGILGFAMILTCLFIFLDFRSGVWVSVGIPFCLAFTAALSLFLGYTINNITLAAVIIVLGIVVDDAIIVAESISRQKSLGEPIHNSVVEGTIQVMSPIIAAIITTCVAFLPLYFFKGHFAAFVKYIPVIVTLMLLASLIESILILPNHLSGGKRNQNKAGHGHWFFSIESAYGKILERILRYRSLVLISFCALLLTSGYLLTTNFKFVIFPQDETKEVFIKLEAQNDISRIEMAKLTRGIENFILSYDHLVVGLRTNIGQSRRKGKRRDNQASLRVELVPKSDRNLTSSEIIDKWNQDIKRTGDFKVIKFIKNRFGFSGGSPIEILIQENNDRKRKMIVNKLQSELAKDKNIADIEVEEPKLTPEYQITYNYEKISRLNIDTNLLTSTIQASIDSVAIFKLNEDDREIEVRLGITPEQQASIESALGGTVANRQGRPIAISELIEVEKNDRPISISRTDYRRTTSVYADLKPAAAKTPLDIAKDLETDLFEEINTNYPSAILSFKGEIFETRSSKSFFTSAAIIVLFLIYGILILLYESFILPIIILAIVPFGIIGVVLAFYSHGKTQVGFFAAVGCIGMIGVVINDSIVLTSTIRNTLKKNDLVYQSIATLTSKRLRAVIVTTITTVAGLFPTAYGFAGFDAMLSEMMLAMGWGLVFGMFITLLLTPILYSYYVSLTKTLTAFGERL